jgi:uncharacterized lipoprotein NlpE involved in copper resistance
MKKIVHSFFWTITVMIILGLGSCRTYQETEQYKPKRVKVSNFNVPVTNLSWGGVYTGTIPSANGFDINVLLKLNLDKTYKLSYSYADMPEYVFNSTGTFKWDEYREIIVLKIKEWPPYYKVGSFKLTVLDLNGKYITDSPAKKYVLKKITP